MAQIVRDDKGNILKPDEPANKRPLYREDGKQICGARKRTGGRCQSPPMKGRNRCIHHIGAGKNVGPDHPQWKDGRYSKYLPRGLNDDYLDARVDEDILNMREQYALLDARLRNVIQRSASGEAAALWKQIGKEWKTFKTAQRVGDVENMTKQLDVVDDLVRRGAGEAMAWEEIARIIEQQRKLGETEQKRLVAMQQMVNKNQLKAVMGRIADIVQQNTTDPKLLNAIATEIRLTFLEQEPARIAPLSEEGRYAHD